CPFDGHEVEKNGASWERSLDCRGVWNGPVSHTGRYESPLRQYLDHDLFRSPDLSLVLGFDLLPIERSSPQAVHETTLKWRTTKQRRLESDLGLYYLLQPRSLECWKGLEKLFCGSRGS